MKCNAQQTANYLEDGLCALWFNSGHVGPFLYYYYIGTEGSANILHYLCYFQVFCFTAAFSKANADHKG